MPSSVTLCKQMAHDQGVFSGITEFESKQTGLVGVGSGQLLDIDLHCAAGVWREKGEEVAGRLARLGVEGRESGRNRGQEASDHSGGTARW